MAEIEKTLRDSNLGINPNSDGTVIRINLPQLTEERRREYIKLARTKAEDAKVSIRNIRRKAKEEIDRLVKDGEIGEDEGARAEKELEHFTKRMSRTSTPSSRSRKASSSRSEADQLITV
jgi:ribosome recycling factor